MTTRTELNVLRDLLERLTSGLLTMRRSGVDVTPSEIAILKREIAFLERCEARAVKGRFDWRTGHVPALQ